MRCGSRLQRDAKDAVDGRGFRPSGALRGADPREREVLAMVVRAALNTADRGRDGIQRDDRERASPQTP